MAAPAPSARHRSGYAPAARRGQNGIGVAALCCGLAGILIGLVPVLFQGSGALGILGIVLGFAGLRRVARGEASNQAVSAAGLAAGVLALGLAIYGLSAVWSGLHQLNVDLDNSVRSGHAPAQAQRTITQEEARLIHRLLWIGNA